MEHTLDAATTEEPLADRITSLRAFFWPATLQALHHETRIEGYVRELTDGISLVLSSDAIELEEAFRVIAAEEEKLVGQVLVSKWCRDAGMRYYFSGWQKRSES